MFVLCTNVIGTRVSRNVETLHNVYNLIKINGNRDLSEMDAIFFNTQKRTQLYRSHFTVHTRVYRLFDAYIKHTRTRPVTTIIIMYVNVGFLCRSYVDEYVVFIYQCVISIRQSAYTSCLPDRFFVYWIQYDHMVSKSNRTRINHIKVKAIFVAIRLILLLSAKIVQRI